MMPGMELVLRVNVVPGPGGPKFKSDINYREVADLVRRGLRELPIGSASGAEWFVQLDTLGPHDTSGWGTASISEPLRGGESGARTRPCVDARVRRR